MEISENVSTSTLHTTQSQPIILGDREEEVDDNNDGAKAKKKSGRKATNRRVSFASSSQYLEPLDPFQSFGKHYTFLLSLIIFLTLSCVHSYSHCKCSRAYQPIPIVM